MKNTMLAATSLLALVAFAAHAVEDGAKVEAVKTETTKIETTAPATTDATKPIEGSKDTAKPATHGTDAVKKDVKPEEKKEEAK